MGFPGCDGFILPKWIVATVLLVSAISRLYHVILELAGLFRQVDNAEWMWQLRAEAISSMDKPSSAAEIIKASLPVMPFRAVLGQYPQMKHAQCAVCLYQFSEEQEIRRLPHCCHIFHKGCMDGWLNHDQKTCPVCRRSVVSEQLAKSEKWALHEEMLEEIHAW